MQIMNTFVAKIGPAGKRNRAARRKQARIMAYHESHMLNRTNNIITNIGDIMERATIPVSTTEILKQYDKQVAADLKKAALESVPVPVVLDFSVPWDETIARKALEAFAQSGQSQRAFAAEHSFPESRLRSWKKKLEG